MSFRDIIGQEQVIEILKSYAKGGKIPHAYLFVGPKGVGKTTCALNFAKLLNCSHPTPDMEPCDSCPSCVAIDEGYHPDLYILSPSEEGREIGIDEVRDLRQSAQMSSAWGKWKIFIVESAELLTPEAEDALLKILEEPPPNSLFILLSTSLTDVAPTIASRCHLLRFKPARIEEVAQFLERRFPSLPAPQVLANLSEGRIGLAINLAEDQKVFHSTRNILFSLFLNLPNHPFYALRATQRFLSLPAPYQEEKEKAQFLLLLSSTIFRDLLSLYLTGDPSFLINVDKEEVLLQHYQRYSLSYLLFALNTLLRTYYLLSPHLTTNLRLALEVMFLDLIEGKERFP